MSILHLNLFFILFLFLFAPLTKAEEFKLSDDIEQLLGMSIENLVQMDNINLADYKKEEFSSTKKLSRIIDNPSAIYTITREDIIRSGAATIPEALRLAPGVNVARAMTGEWSVDVRGGGAQFSDKFLFLVDNMEVYTPFFTGVFWDVQEAFMENIARIEVIRGPGGTLWGQNAVNGIINVITKKARGTQGTLLETGFGAGDTRGMVAARKGGKIGENTYYRTHIKHVSRASFDTLEGNSAMSPFEMTRGGFRVDWKKSQQDSFMFRGDAYYGKNDHLFTTVGESDVEVDGINVLAKWDRNLSETNHFTAQTYFRYDGRNERVELDENVFNMDFAHHFDIGKRNHFSWGAGFRNSFDRFVHNAPIIAFIFDLEPRRRHFTTASIFLQNKFDIIPNKLFFTVGSKFEHNSFTEYEHQPNARLGWKVDQNQFVWAAVSRALRRPSRADVDLSVTTGPIVVEGNEAIKPAEAVTYELGYKNSAFPGVYFDIAAFFTDYSKLLSSRITPTAVERWNFGKEGHSYGGEIAGSWDVTDNWELKGSYSLNHIVFTVEDDDDLGTSTLRNRAGTTPSHKYSVMSFYEFPRNVSMTNILYRVNGLKMPEIDAYYRFDTRFNWQPNARTNVSFVAKNIFDDKHQEFQAFQDLTATEVPRSYYVSLKYEF